MGDGCNSRKVYEPYCRFAVRVSWSYHLWSIILIVYRWAWQHAGDSRHIKPDDEDFAHVVNNPKTGRARPRARRSARSLTAHLSDLHLLLRSGYFSNWPLTVRFFCADVYRVWNLWNERADGHLPHHIQIIPDGNCGPPNDSSGDYRVGSAEHIRPDHSGIRNYLEKATFLLEDSEDLRCKVCEAHLIPMEELVLVCPQANCYSTAHLICLSERFLNAAENPDQLVPTDGICPACKETVKWPLMMQELTLRCRGEKELRSILRKKRKEDNRSSNNGRAERHADAVDDVDSLAQNLPTPDLGFHIENYGDGNNRDDSPLDEDWLDALEVGSGSDTGDRLTTQSKQNPPRVEIVIEDSDEAD